VPVLPRRDAVRLSNFGAAEQDAGMDEERARELAVKRLGRRECSRAELRRYLEGKGAEGELAGRVVEALAERGWIDDARYARMLARDQLKRGKGAIAVAMKLRQKGVPMDAGAVRELTTAEGFPDELEAARALVERKYPGARADRAQGARAYQFLLRRGFSHDVAMRALRNSVF
jgi:regulatory protein